MGESDVTMNADKGRAEQASHTHRRRDEEGILYVGIDLGTSHTSVSASNGVRETVKSIVGYPKDVVAKKTTMARPAA